MKAFLIGLLLLVGGEAQASSLMENYLQARDRHVRALDREADDSRDEKDKAALHDLEKQLNGLIGPVELQGFSRKGTINLQTLQRDQMGFGALDALVYTTGDKRTQVVVTTQPLLKVWIEGHKSQYETQNVPQDMESALTSEPFYTQAIGSDAAVVRYAQIPVSRLADGGFAYAMLSAYQQDLSPSLPTEVIVTVLNKDKVFIFSQPVEAKIQKIAACDTLWKQYEQKAAKALKAYSTSQDEKLFDESQKLHQEGNSAFHRCFAERFKEQVAFAAVQKQAQTLIERLPSQ